jgi:hypothetical protein
MPCTFHKMKILSIFITMKDVKKKSKYDEVFKVNASFDQLIAMSVAGNPKPKPKEKKNKEGKKKS